MKYGIVYQMYSDNGEIETVDKVFNSANEMYQHLVEAHNSIFMVVGEYQA